MGTDKTVGMTFNAPPDEAEAIEAWMVKNRVFSRGRALRCLVRYAIANDAPLDEETDMRTKEERAKRGRG